MGKITMQQYAEIHAQVMALPRRQRDMIEAALVLRRTREADQASVKAVAVPDPSLPLGE